MIKIDIFKYDQMISTLPFHTFSDLMALGFAFFVLMMLQRSSLKGAIS